MNDYKELIENVRICTSGDCCGCTLHSNKINCQEVLLESAADAIEQLVNERDAAVADLRNAIADDFSLSQCHYCKYQEEDGQCHHDCIMFSPEWGWEWRGVKEDNDGKID